MTTTTETATEERTLDVHMTELRERREQLREKVRAADAVRDELAKIERVITAHEAASAPRAKRGASEAEATA
jgi:hypothetical protein